MAILFFDRCQSSPAEATCREFQERYRFSFTASLFKKYVAKIEKKRGKMDSYTLYYTETTKRNQRNKRISPLKTNETAGDVRSIGG